MWKNDEQACRAIRRLLEGARLERLWTATGPTNEAVKSLKDGGYLSSGEKLMLRIAFDFWNAHGQANFARMLEVLDRDRMRAVCTLAVALCEGPAAIEEWIDA